MRAPKKLSEELYLLNCWQFGDWPKLAMLDLKGSKSEEFITLKAVGHLQLGEILKAKNTLNDLPSTPNQQTKKLLISSLLNTLGKACAIAGQIKKAEAHFEESIEVAISSCYSIGAAKQVRKSEQFAQIGIFNRWISLDDLDRSGKTKKLFIDCGGHDGCSTIKFKLDNPSYDIVTFEGNPELWHYYSNLPTQLIKKLVSDRNGEVEFIIDPIDADGSSIIKEKNIDFYKKIKNEDCPVIVMPCVNLSEFIKEQAQHYEEIVLKLDVEGAEYAILKKMLEDGSVKFVKKLYAEFHWNKINFPKAEHDALVEQLKGYFEIEGWDAAEFQIHTKGISNHKIRQQVLNAINSKKVS